MINFPESVQKSIANLQQGYGGKNLVVAAFPILEILKQNDNGEVSIKLFFDYKLGTFEIQPPTYRFFSKISHFDFKKPERRWTRNKEYLFGIINHLKIAGLWEIVSNKDFLVVNEHNEKVDVRLLKETLKGIKK